MYDRVSGYAPPPYAQRLDWVVDISGHHMTRHLLPPTYAERLDWVVDIGGNHMTRHLLPPPQSEHTAAPEYIRRETRLGGRHSGHHMTRHLLPEPQSQHTEAPENSEYVPAQQREG